MKRFYSDPINRARVKLQRSKKMKAHWRNPERRPALLKSSQIQKGNRRPQFWTAERDALLIDRYPAEGAGLVSTLLGVSVNAVWHRARFLEVICRDAKRIRIAAFGKWRPEYDAILVERFAISGSKTLAIELGVSDTTVENNASRLGLTQEKEVWTSERDAILVAQYSVEGATTLARILGLSLPAVYHRARRLGLRYSWKTYVGSSLDIADRWKGHVRGLRRGEHHARPLQAAFNKYGPAAFVMDVLELCEAGQLHAREQHYIDTLRPAFNAALLAGYPNGPRRKGKTA